MRSVLALLISIFALVAFTCGAIAQEKKAESPAPAVEKTQPEKPKAAKSMRALGTVVAYEAGKTITVKGRKGQEWMFDIAPDAKIKGDVKKGGKIRVGYKKEDDKMVATYISVATPKKAKPLTKEGETK